MAAPPAAVRHTLLDATGGERIVLRNTTATASFGTARSWLDVIDVMGVSVDTVGWARSMPPASGAVIAAPGGP